MQRPTIEELNALMAASPGRHVHITISDKFAHHIEQYFNSIRESLQDSLKRRKLIDVLNTILTLALIVIGIAVVYLALILLPYYREMLPVHPALYAIFVLVGVSVLLSLFNKDFFPKQLKNFLYKDYLSDEAIRFCYVQLAYKNLEDYIINEQNKHLNAAHKLMKEYLDEENLYLKHDDIQDLFVPDLVENLSKQISWFKVNEESKRICEGFYIFKKYFLPQVLTGQDIQHKRDSLLYLKAYAYCNIFKRTKETITMNGHEIPLITYGYDLLSRFADEMRFVNSDSVEKKTISFKQRVIILFNQINNITEEYLHHPKILVRLLTLSVLVIGSILLLKILGVVITETVIAIGGIILTSLYVATNKSKG